jgi:hypothetical protein
VFREIRSEGVLRSWRMAHVYTQRRTLAL